MRCSQVWVPWPRLFCSYPQETEAWPGVGTCPGFQCEGAPRTFAVSTAARGAGGLTVAIRVVEGHSGRAHRQQRLLQRGGGDVFGVEQAGAMARGSEGDICEQEKGRGQRWGGGASRTRSRLRHLPAAGPGERWRRRRGPNARSSCVAMTARTSEVQGRMGGARSRLQTSLATGRQKGQKNSIPTILSRAFSGEKL